MTSEERAQETFRSLATEAVNNIMDALDMLGDFAPLHKNEMYGPEVDECFNAIAEYLEKTSAKYEPDKRTRFVFASERSKRADLSPNVDLPVERQKTAVRAKYGGGIELFENGVSVGIYKSATEIGELLGCSNSNVSRALKTGRMIQDRYMVKKVERGNVNEQRSNIRESAEGSNSEGSGYGEGQDEAR